MYSVLFELVPPIIRLTQKIPFRQAAKRQNSSEIRVSVLSPQMSNMTIDASAKPQIFAKKQRFIDNFLPISDSMAVFKVYQSGADLVISFQKMFFCEVDRSDPLKTRHI